MNKKLDKLTKQIQVEIETPFNEENKVERVQFYFTKEQWADLADKKGELLPACCASVSAIRTCFINAMNDDGWMDAKDIYTIVVNMDCHDWTKDHPAMRVKKVYETLEDYLQLEKLNSCDPNSLSTAKSTVWFSDIWKFCSEYGSNSIFGEWGKSAQERATHNKNLYNIMPTVRALNNYLSDTKFGPADGYAIIRKANNEIYQHDRGLALFQDQNKAQDCLNIWIKTKQINKTDCYIGKVRVSLENGVEFIDKIENEWELIKDLKIDIKQSDELFRDLNDLRRKNDTSYKNDKVESILLNALKEIEK